MFGVSGTGGGRRQSTAYGISGLEFGRFKIKDSKSG